MAVKFRPPDVWKVSKPKLTFIDLLKKHLSHGSGIDADWSFEEDEYCVSACNSYHRMDENGYYREWLDFCLDIPKRDIEDFNLYFLGQNAKGIAERYGLDEYLADIFLYDLSIVKKEMKRGGML